MKDRSKIQKIPKGLKYPKNLESYLRELLDKSTSAYEVAQKAREKGYDPAKRVEMEIANDIPSVVEAMVGPKGVAKRIRKLMKSGKEGEEISLTIAKEIAEGVFGQEGIEEKASQAVKTALSIATGGITAAPLEGVTKVKVRDDRHLAVYYAGPIRSAGGTETALSVLIADVVRRTLGLERYEIPEKVKERIIEETILYDRRRNLQFPVNKEKLEFVLEHLPVEINGGGSTEIKVSGPYRRVENVNTARARTGVVLVVNDGLIGKAKKLLRIISNLHVEGWEWLEELKNIGEGHNETNGEEKVGGSDAFMEDIIVGRPVFSSPSQIGGFRLRYGRARNTGLAALGIHPATMYLLDDFLATGTQIKTEMPGKAAVTVPVDSIMPPIVRLNNGNVIKVNKIEEMKKIKDKVDKILFLGDILSAVGEFFENNKKILPSPIVEEWWRQELENAIKKKGWNKEDLSLDELIRKGREDPEFSFELTEKVGIPLHPRYTYFWGNINGEELKYLKAALKEKTDGGLKYSGNVKTILEKLLIPHKLTNSRIELNECDLQALEKTVSQIDTSKIDEGENGLEIVKKNCNIQNKYPVFVGARMGRPEKAKPRKLKPPVHVLFPMGKSGAKNRSITRAARKEEESKVEMRSRYCPDCKSLTFRHRCPECGKEAVPVKICDECNKHFLNREICPSCNSPLKPYKTYEINFNELLQSGMEKLDISSPPKVKGVKGVISKEKVPEPIEKGILRGKEGVFVFKDGTARFDATDLPLTHFKPKEINTSVEDLRKLGYKKDIEGKKLEEPNQLVEIKPQDIIISEEGLKYLYKIAKFVDGLLTKFYDLPPYYEVSEAKDLLGKLVIGMAPHTSSGIVGRIIGTTKSRGIYSHPYWHAAKRRNCFHPDTKIWVNTENNSWQYLTIKQFVEQTLNEETAKKDAFGTVYQEPTVKAIVPSIDQQGKPTFKQVKAVSRHLPTDHMLKITTRSGRTLKVTPDHSMIRWQQDNLVKVDARELSVDDKIPCPKAIDFEEKTQHLDLRIIEQQKQQKQQLFTDGGRCWIDKITSIETIKPDIEYTYSLTVKDTHTLIANGVYTGQCDGDEDAIMLLLDGLLNFSKKFLPERRGGKMDAPLVIRTILKPEVVDAEVFNIELNDSLPMEFYRKSQKRLELDEANSIIEKIEDRLGTKRQYFDFPYNIPTENINQGPAMTSYKKLKNMEEKANKQLNTVSKIAAVDTKQIASKLLSDHILPDIVGNLRAFGRQRFRCTQCNKKFITYPLQGKCPNCGGDVHLTVFRGTITKYLSLADKIIEEYDVTNYIRSRYEILKKTDLTSLKKVNILGNAIKNAKKQRTRRKKDTQKSKAIKKEKKIKIEDYL